MKKALIGILIICFVVPSFAQENTSTKKGGPRRQLATILFAGLGGAILGLSTLSFYGRPQDNLGNIGIGFAVGVVAGTVYVTYRSATSHDYDDSADSKGLKWAPLIAQTKSDSTVLGSQFLLRF